MRWTQEASPDPSQALEYFQRALTLRPSRGTKGNILGWLASARYQLATEDNLHPDAILLGEAEQNFESAQRLRGLSKRELDLLQRIRAIRINPNLRWAFLFFENAGFEVVRIFRPDTHAVDFLIFAKSKELILTYKLDEPTLMSALRRRLESAGQMPTFVPFQVTLLRNLAPAP
jgi:hypothetical protein